MSSGPYRRAFGLVLRRGRLLPPTTGADSGVQRCERRSEKLIAELCRQFYHLGWCTGTGGGIAIREET